jgi:hypothetical protein
MKIMIAMFLIFLLYACAPVKAVICPPFDKAMTYAKSGETAPSGVFLKSLSAVKDADQYDFRFVYAPQDGTVCLGGDPGEGYEIYCHTPGVGYYQYLGGGMIIYLEEKEAAEKAFVIFRKMVELGLP